MVKPMIYSPSRLSCFENCPKQFEFRYVKRVKVPKHDTIEAFMGKKVHETFEKLFRDLQHTKQNTLEELLDHYTKAWNSKWHDGIVINKEGLTKDHYFELGKKCITNFYEKNKPFKFGKILGIEHKLKIDLNEDGKYKIQGVIDLLVQKDKNHFQIHDYKTYGKLPDQEKIESDPQLAFYQLWVEREFPEAKKIDLIWHYVVFDREGTSHRTKKQLENLRQKLTKLITKIENTKKYNTHVTPLCNYCPFKPICPAWTHAIDLQKPPQKFDPKDGQKLADEYVKLKEEEKEVLARIETRLEELKSQIFAFAEQHGYEVVQGTTKKLSIKTTERTSWPAKKSEERAQLEKLIREHNLWNDLTELDTHKLTKQLEEGQIDKKTAKLLEKYIEKNETRTIYIGKL